MASTPIQKITFIQWLKHPTTAMLIVAVSLIWLLIIAFTRQSSDSVKQCEARNSQLYEENIQLREDKDNLTTALLVKNGIINEIKKTADSLSTEVKK